MKCRDMFMLPYCDTPSMHCNWVKGIFTSIWKYTYLLPKVKFKLMQYINVSGRENPAICMWKIWKNIRSSKER